MSDVEDTHEKQPLLDQSGSLSTNASVKQPREEQDSGTEATGLKIETHYKPKVGSLWHWLTVYVVPYLQ